MNASTASKPSPSPFQSSGFGQNSQFGQAGFGTQAPKSNIFGSAAQTFPASGFGSQAQTPPAMGSSVFGGIVSRTSDGQLFFLKLDLIRLRNILLKEAHQYAQQSLCSV